MEPFPTMDDPEALGDLEPLRSRYEILSALGRDGLALLFRGRDREGQSEVVIRLFGRPHPYAPGPHLRLEREIEELSRTDHPNLVGLRAVHRLPTAAIALVMQFGPWRTLAETIRATGPMPAERVERVLRDLGQALAHLHGRGRVHGRVAPESVFLDEETGRALLADFGVDDEDRSGDAAPAGSLLRAFAHMSPEELDGARPTRHGDLFSLGLLGYEMLSGERTWQRSGLGSLATPGRRESLPGLAAVRPDIPEHLLRAVEGALHEDPEMRWSSAGAFLEQLDPDPVAGRRVLGAHGPRLLLPGRGRRGAAQLLPSGRRRLFAGMALAGAAAVVALLDGSPSPSARPAADFRMPADESVSAGGDVLSRAGSSPVAPRSIARADPAPPPPGSNSGAAPAQGDATPGPRRIDPGNRATSTPPTVPLRAQRSGRPGAPRLLGVPVPLGIPVPMGTPVPPPSPEP